MTRLNRTWVALAGLTVGCSSSKSDSGFWWADTGARLAADEGSTNGGGGDLDDGYDAEVEADGVDLLPAATERYVFVANPARNTVSRVTVADLSVVTTEVGVDPLLVRTSPDHSTAVVFNRGTDDLSIVDSESMTVRTVQVRPDFNAMVMSPDGAWVACFHDAENRDPEDLSEGAWSFNEVSLVEVGTGTHWPLVVGFNPREVRFADDASRMLVVSDAYLAVVELGVDSPEPVRLPISEDALEPPLAEEVLITPDGQQAIVRQAGGTHLVLADLVGLTTTQLPVGDTPTDLDVTPDGLQAVAVARGAGELWVYDLADLDATPEVLTLPAGEVLGSVVMSPDNSKALLYSTASGTSRYASWHRDRPEDPFEVHGSVKPISAVRLSPDGGVALLTHDRDNGDVDEDSVFYNEHVITMVDLDDFFANPIRVPDAPSETAVTDDGAMGFLIMDGRPDLVQLDFSSLLHDDIELKSGAEHLGVMPGTRLVYISQTHELGRISFFDPNAGELSTVTGFELNAGIEVE
jgi:DNA-binding beta-propeller fold protein YncE